MSDFFNNQWTVGIGGSIISGIIVYLITEQIFKRKINKEISENIRLANAEIIYAIRPLVAANVAPSNSMISSLIKSTAKKHDVLSNNLIDWPDIVDQLTKEVLENSFLTPENKLQYCQFLNGLLNQYQDPEKPAESEKSDLKYFITRKNTFATEIATIISIFFAALSAIITFLLKNKFVDDKLSTKTLISNETVLGLIALFAVSAMVIARIYMSNRKSKILKEQIDEARRLHDDINSHY